MLTVAASAAEVRWGYPGKSALVLELYEAAIQISVAPIDQYEQKTFKMCEAFINWVYAGTAQPEWHVHILGPINIFEYMRS